MRASTCQKPEDVARNLIEKESSKINGKMMKGKTRDKRYRSTVGFRWLSLANRLNFGRTWRCNPGRKRNNFPNHMMLKHLHRLWFRKSRFIVSYRNFSDGHTSLTSPSPNMNDRKLRFIVRMYHIIVKSDGYRLQKRKSTFSSTDMRMAKFPIINKCTAMAIYFQEWTMKAPI